MHLNKFSAISIVPLLAFVCLSDTAAGQAITLQNSSQVSVTALTFSVPANTSHTTTTFQQVLTVIPNQGPSTIQVAVGSPNPGWLWVGGSSTAVQLNSVPTITGTTFSVNVDTTGLSANTTVNTYMTVCYASLAVNLTNCAQGTTSGSAQIQVTLNVTNGNSGGGNITATPNNFQFTAAAGSTTATGTANSVLITSIAGSFSYTMTASTLTGGNWLLVNGATSTSGVENNGAAISVGISSTILPTLAAGTYSGSISVIDTQNNSTTITVTLTVSGGTGLTATPGAFTFLYQTHQTTPAQQNLTVSTNSSSSIGFTLGTSTSVSWLVPSTLSGTVVNGAPVTIGLNVNVNQLSTGTYTTNLLLNSLSGTTLATIPVTLAISNNPLLQLTCASVTPCSSLSFNAAFAGQSPPSQTVQVSTTGSGGSVGFSANPSSASASWLNVSTSSNSASQANPATLTISVNSGSLPVGNTTGSITVTPTNGDNYTETITVSVTVSNAAQITVGPSTLLFSLETKISSSGTQSVSVQSTGQNTTFTTGVTTNSCGNNWLSVSNASGQTTPATLLVNVSLPNSTPAGVCTGTVAVTPSGSNNPVNVSVTVVVSTTTPLLTLQSQSAGFGVFTMQQGGSAPNTQFLVLGSTDNTSLPFGVQYTSQGNWLYTTTTNGNTPSNLGVNVNPNGLSAGTYGGTLTITSPTLSSIGGSFAITITLVVTPNVTVTESPSTMSFTFQANAASPPASQNITLTSSGGTASYTAAIASQTSCPSGLLGVSPTSGSANGTIQVSISSTNFTAGTYTCQIGITYVNSVTASSTVAVTITVTPAVTVTVAPLTLAYTYTIGGTQPASQAITISSTGGAVQFTVGTTTTGTSGNWLSVDTTSGNTGGTGTTLTKTVNVSVNTAGLAGSATGTQYSGTVTISASGVLATPISVAVTLTVTQPPNPGITFVTSNASNLAGVIAPGELLTIKGTLLGPTTPVSFSVNSSGGVNNTLAGVQVTFDGIPGTPIYVSAVQINVTAPWEIAGRLTTNIIVTYNGNSSSTLPVRVNDFAPAVYTLNSTGSGQAAAVNQNGTFNGPPGGSTVPAPAGTVVVLYTTGCGQTSPPGTTGSVAPLTQLLEVTAPVAVGFGPVSNPLYGKVLFIGAAPGLVTGVCQINVQTPTGLTSGNQFVTVTVGGISSPQGPTIAIQ